MEDTTQQTAAVSPTIILPAQSGSTKDSLTRADWEQWMKNTIVFSIPALLALLIALQNKQTVGIALGMAMSALITSAIDLLRKYSAGN